MRILSGPLESIEHPSNESLIGKPGLASSKLRVSHQIYTPPRGRQLLPGA